MKDKQLAHEIGKIIKNARQFNRNITRDEVSYETGLDPNNLGRIERGEQLPKTETLIKLIISLNADILAYTTELDQALKQNEHNNTPLGGATYD